MSSIELSRFLKWLQKTEGRDKLYRLIAYGSKIPIYILTTYYRNPILLQRLQKGASQIGLSRKLFRFFRSVQFIQDFLKANSTDLVDLTLTRIKAMSLGIWMAMDHFQWLHKVGYITLPNQKTINTVHSKAWFVGLFVGLVQNLYQLQTNKNSKNPSKWKRGVLKNGLDLIIPAQRLGWVNVHDGIVGCCGTITSIMGIQDTYPPI
jgi:peroxin-11B